MNDPSATPQADAQAPSSRTGLVDWDDTSFTPEVSHHGSGDPIKWFRMDDTWPNKPFEDRKFQLGGKERVAILDSKVSVFWAHRFNQRFMGSAVNGTRRCSLEERGRCVLCEHYEAAPSIEESGQKKKKSRCGRRQQIFGVNLLVYKTDLEGKLVTEDGQHFIYLDPEKGPVLMENGQATDKPAELCYDVYLWRFNAEKFQDIREIKAEWDDLTQHDLIFTLAANKDTKFQDFSPTVSPRSAWRMTMLGPKGKAAGKEILEYYKEHRFDVEAILGKLYSDQEMLGFLGPDSPQPGQAPTMPGEGAAQVAPEQAVGDVATQIEEEIARIEGGGNGEAPAVTETTQPTPQPTPPTEPTTPAESSSPPAEQAPPPQAPAERAEAVSDFDALLND